MHPVAAGMRPVAAGMHPVAAGMHPVCDWSRPVAPALPPLFFSYVAFNEAATTIAVRHEDRYSDAGTVDSAIPRIEPFDRVHRFSGFTAGYGHLRGRFD